MKCRNLRLDLLSFVPSTVKNFLLCRLNCAALQICDFTFILLTREATMTFSIVAPMAAPRPTQDVSSNSDASIDSDGDVDVIRPAKRSKTAHKAIITPGEVVTEDVQWMRCRNITVATLEAPLTKFMLQRSWHDSHTRFLRYPRNRSRHPASHQQAAIHSTSTCPIHTRDWRPSRRPHRLGRDQTLESRPICSPSRTSPPLRDKPPRGYPKEKNGNR